MNKRRGYLKQVLVAVTILSIVAAVVLLTLGIWTGDDRWGMTGGLPLMIGMGLGLTAPLWALDD